MPSAPNADEIATSLPKVSNAHDSTCCGFQLSAVNCTSAILSFTLPAPYLFPGAAPARGMSSKAPADANCHLPSTRPASQIPPPERRDQPTAQLRPRPAALERQVAAHDADRAQSCDGFADAWWWRAK